MNYSQIVQLTGLEGLEQKADTKYSILSPTRKINFHYREHCIVTGYLLAIYRLPRIFPTHLARQARVTELLLLSGQTWGTIPYHKLDYSSSTQHTEVLLGFNCSTVYVDTS